MAKIKKPSVIGVGCAESPLIESRDLEGNILRF